MDFSASGSWAVGLRQGLTSSSPQFSDLWTQSEFYHQLSWFSSLPMADGGTSQPHNTGANSYYKSPLMSLCILLVLFLWRTLIHTRTATFPVTPPIWPKQVQNPFPGIIRDAERRLRGSLSPEITSTRDSLSLEMLATHLGHHKERASLGVNQGRGAKSWDMERQRPDNILWVSEYSYDWIHLNLWTVQIHEIKNSYLLKLVWIQFCHFATQRVPNN